MQGLELLMESLENRVKSSINWITCQSSGLFVPLDSWDLNVEVKSLSILGALQKKQEPEKLVWKLTSESAIEGVTGFLVSWMLNSKSLIYSLGINIRHSFAYQKLEFLFLRVYWFTNFLDIRILTPFDNYQKAKELSLLYAQCLDLELVQEFVFLVCPFLCRITNFPCARMSKILELP